MTTEIIQQCTAPLDVKAAMESIMTGGTNASAVQTDLDTVEASVIVDLNAIITAIGTITTAIDAIATKVNASATNCSTNLHATIGTIAVTTA